MLIIFVILFDVNYFVFMKINFPFYFIVNNYFPINFEAIVGLFRVTITKKRNPIRFI